VCDLETSRIGAPYIYIYIYIYIYDISSLRVNCVNRDTFASRRGTENFDDYVYLAKLTVM